MGRQGSAGHRRRRARLREADALLDLIDESREIERTPALREALAAATRAVDAALAGEGTSPGNRGAS